MQRVLILDQGDLTNPFRVAHTLAIRAALTEDASLPLEIYTEGLDIDRFPGRKHRRLMTDLIQKKYRDRPIDLIITEGLDAMDFAIKFRIETRQKMPIIFSVVETEAVRRTVLPAQVSGVATKSILRESVQLAATLVPGTRNVVILGDDESQAIHLIDEEISRQLVAIKFQQEINVMNGMPISTVLQSIGNLPKDAVILYMGITRDSAGQYFSPRAVLKTIVKTTNRPIFVINDALIGDGVVGGIIVKPTDGARDVAEIAKRVLRGEDASTIPVVFIDPKTPIFDSRALNKWGIPRETLPANSELLYYEPTLWERYSWLIVAVVAIVLLQAFLIVALIIEHRRRRRTELRFRRTMTEFAHLNRITSLGELSASIAHELNQPLAAILINSEAAELLLAASPPAIEEARRAVRDIRFDNIRAGEIIRGMRSLFNKAEFGLVALDINEIVGETIRFVAWDAKAKDVKIITNLTADLPRVAADRVQLTQVVLNLLTNAVEASGSSSAEEKKVTITSRLATFNDVELSVEDNGSGIPPHVLGQVFNPFYTTKIHGMGMGLSISRTIIEAHGSRIEVQNLKGGGVIFNFKLRRAKDR